MTHIIRRRVLAALSLSWLGGCGGAAEEEAVPAITYSEFSGGLDRRLPIGVQDANRLWTLKNAYVTLGKKIKKRPALVQVAGLTSSVGLESLNGRRAVFVDGAGGMTAFPTYDLYRLDKPGTISGSLSEVSYATVFQGFVFVVAHYSSGETRYHYLDGATTYITDANCPNTRGVTKSASRIFAPDGADVRYCAAGDVRDWTTASDAGFLPCGLQQDTSADVTACGTFEDALVVFFPDGAQIWDVAVDPSANQIRKRIYGVGCNAPASLSSFFRDLVFLSPFGFRSMTVQESTDRIDDTDVGVQIDSLVDATSTTARGLWVPQFGQYWCVFPGASTTTVWVYTVSRASKIACWSEYEFTLVVTGICTVGGSVFLRGSDGNTYRLDPDVYEDSVGGIGQAVAVDVQMAFQDAKLPGVEKMFYGADFVFSGTADVSYLYDPRDTSKETAAYSVTGDTRTTTVVPVEVSAAAIAPRFRHSANEAFEISLLTLYFHSLSATAS